MISSIFSSIAILLSIASLYTAWQLWKLSNRPVVSVAVETAASGNPGTALKLVVRNEGNRPAKDVRLEVNSAALDSLLAKNTNNALIDAVRRCFQPSSTIPLLSTGCSTECSFGLLAGESSDSTWRKEATLHVTISYADLTTGRTFRHTVTIRIADNSSFTGSMWSSKA